MRITLKQILMATAVLSVYLSMLCGTSGLGGIAAAILLCALTAFLPSMSITGILYSRGYHRAFWIGSLPSALTSPILAYSGLFSLIDDFHDYDNAQATKYLLAGFHAWYLLGGIVSAVVRWAYGGRRPSMPCWE